MNTIKIFFLLGLLVVCACGKHNSDSFGVTNNQDIKKGEVSDTPEEFMMDAITQGKDEEFNKLIEEPQNINLMLKDGRTPLIQSVISDKTKYVFKLLDLGADRNLTDKFQKTAIVYAEELGRERIKSMLDPQKQATQQSDLFVAVQNGASKAVTDLLAGGANPNFLETSGQTCLTLALTNKKMLVALALVNWKDPEFGLTATDLNMANSAGVKPLVLARQMEVTKAPDKKNKEKIINALIEGGATE